MLKKPDGQNRLVENIFVRSNNIRRYKARKYRHLKLPRSELKNGCIKKISVYSFMTLTTLLPFEQETETKYTPFGCSCRSTVVL